MNHLLVQPGPHETNHPVFAKGIAVISGEQDRDLSITDGLDQFAHGGIEIARCGRVAAPETQEQVIIFQVHRAFGRVGERLQRFVFNGLLFLVDLVFFLLQRLFAEVGFLKLLRHIPRRQQRCDIQPYKPMVTPRQSLQGGAGRFQHTFQKRFSLFRERDVDYFIPTRLEKPRRRATVIHDKTGENTLLA